MRLGPPRLGIGLVREMQRNRREWRDSNKETGPSVRLENSPLAACAKSLPQASISRRSWRRIEDMLLHDWTRVSAGTFHDFHNSWNTHLKEALSAGLLLSPYYALGEQQAGDVKPDVPLKETYEKTWAGVPERWRRVIET